MIKQTLFTVVLLITLGVFAWSVFRLRAFFKLTKPAYPIKNISARITRTLNVAFGQSKIFRKPVIGFMHALVFWGFLVITFGSVEMVFDGLIGSDRSFAFMGTFYDVMMASGDVFAFIILVFIIFFLIRRKFMNISRLKGVEITPKTNLDAELSLYFIGFLMLSLLVFNLGYISNHSNEVLGAYPVSSKIIQWTSMDFGALQESGWWGHILLIFVFANYLPYSKHFHVFLSIPNVFLSNLEH